jgi:hypothetical protein
MSARAAHRVFGCRSDRNIICDFIGILHLIFTYFLSTCTLATLATTSAKVRCRHPHRTLSQYTHLFFLEDIAAIFIFRVVFDGGTTSARAAREARDGAWVQIGSLYYLRF